MYSVPNSQSFAISDVSDIAINPLKSETHYSNIKKSRSVSQKTHGGSISKITRSVLFREKNRYVF
jgi:hypothetical protein